jgi:vitamin K-dependent gamma-carboxylase
MVTDARPSSFRARLVARAEAPVDAASLCALRIAFGMAMLVTVARFFSHGWIRSYFIEPHYFFSYWGFSWVRPWPGAGMYVHFAALAVLAAAIALGLYTRLATLLFTLGFAYAHLIDKTNYLNHYFLVVALGLLGTLLPWNRTFSLDAVRARRRGQPWRETVPAWTVWAPRVQLGLVYTYGGIAKLGPDWLLHAQPLKIWLAANSDFPVLGRFFDAPALAFALSWAAALFDLSIPWLLAHRPTRRFAYLAVLAFHLTTAQLFHIGMFPWLMIAWTPIFFAPAWPRRLLPRGFAPQESPGRAQPTARVSFAFAAAILAVQAILPWRHLFYPGNLLWTEEGFRFSFKVMVMEKVGNADFWVTDRQTGQRFLVSPREFLTAYQARMMATQPDMILAFAHHLAAEFRRRGIAAPEVRADVVASLNGRPFAPLVDPSVDLARLADGLAPKRWITPAPAAAPP